MINQHHFTAKGAQTLLQVSKCQDGCSAPVLEGKYCEKHGRLRKLRSQKQYLQSKRSSRGRGKEMDIIDEQCKELAKHQEKRNERILYTGGDEAVALRALYAPDEKGNDFTNTAGRVSNRVASAQCVGCLDVNRYCRIVDGSYIVRELGTHKDHPPTQRRYSTWNHNQKAALEEMLITTPSLSALDAWETRDVTLFPHNNQLKTKLLKWWGKRCTKAPKSQPASLNDFRTIIEEFKTDMNGSLGDHDPILVPLPGSPHLLTGHNVPRITNDSKPRQTVSGTHYAACLPGTTRALMSRVESAHAQLYIKLTRIFEDGFETEEVESPGLALTDGVWDLVIRVGTLTRNGKYRRIGEVLGSGELDGLST